MPHHIQGALATLYDRICAGSAPTLKQFEAFLEEADYGSRDFWPATTLLIATMPRAKRYDAAMMVNAKTPQGMFPDARALQTALDNVVHLDAPRQAAALREIAYRAPSGSDVGIRAEKRLNGEDDTPNTLTLAGFTAAVQERAFSRLLITG